MPATEYDVGVARSNFLGYRNDVDRSDTDMLTVRYSHDVNDKVTVTSDTCPATRGEQATEAEGNALA